MSLIKAVDVPKYMADKMRSRRLATRLAGGSAKPTVVATAPVGVAPAKGTDLPPTIL